MTMDACTSAIFPFSSGNSVFGTYTNFNIQFNGGVHFFCFRPETPFLGKFGSKNQNYQFKLKFGS